MESLDTEKLISEIQSHPILYDQSSSSYKDNDRKNNVWRILAESLDSNGMYVSKSN